VEPSEAIEAGRKILDGVLLPAAFAFVPGAAGKGSGGTFASAAYVRGERRLEFSYRWAVGEVTYYIGDDALGHDSYMRLLHVYAQSEFARFSRDEPLAGFEALGHDLKHFCGDFLTGPGTEFQMLARRLKADPKCIGGFRALDRY
jgi:hypothetical protein